MDIPAKFKIPIPFDLEIILPGIYPTNILVSGERVYIQMNYRGMVREDWKPAVNGGVDEIHCRVSAME